MRRRIFSRSTIWAIRRSSIASFSSIFPPPAPARGAWTPCAAAAVCRSPRRLFLSPPLDGEGYRQDPRFPAHFLLYGCVSKRMPSHPHPVINEELPHKRNCRTASLGADAGCSGTGGDIPQEGLFDGNE